MGKSIIMSAAIVAGALMAIPAWAESHGTAPVAITADAMKQKISDLGYDVRRLEAGHGRYEAQLVDRESGGGVKAHFDGTSGELLRAELNH